MALCFVWSDSISLLLMYVLLSDMLLLHILSPFDVWMFHIFSFNHPLAGGESGKLEVAPTDNFWPLT
jgi:hypothetical protein